MDDKELEKANEKAKVCADFLNYVLEHGYVLVDMDSIRARAGRYGDDPDRLQGVIEMSTPINPMRLAYDMLNLECPTSYTEDAMMHQHQTFKRLSGRQED